MAKPPLPEIPAEISKDGYKPKQTGKAPLSAIVAMFVIAIIATPLIFIFGFNLVGLLLKFLLEFMGNPNNNGLLIIGSVVAFLLYLVISGIFVGAVIGGVITGVGYLTKSRSFRWNLVAGALAAAVGIATVAVPETRQMIAIFHKMEWFDWLYLLEFVIATLVVSVLSIGLGFCENCNTWYIGERVALLSIDSADALIEAVKSADFEMPQDLKQVTTHPHLIVNFRHCPTCETSPELITVELAWKEERENAVEQKSTWLTATLPPQHGKLMRDRLMTISQAEMQKV